MLKISFQEPLGQFQPNLAGNMPGGWGFIFVQIEWLNKENFDKSSKIFSSTTGRNALIFGMEYPCGKEIQVC